MLALGYSLVGALNAVHDEPHDDEPSTGESRRAFAWGVLRQIQRTQQDQEERIARLEEIAGVRLRPDDIKGPQHAGEVPTQHE